MKAVILKAIWVALIVVGVMIMSAENGDGDLSFITMFIGGCCELLAWGMWENCPELKLSYDEEKHDDRF